MPIFNKTRMVDLTPAITAGAYTAGDVIGGMLTFDVHSAGGGGTIRRVTLIDVDNEKAAGKLYLFNSAPTSTADNAAFAPSAADMRKLIDVVSISAADYASVNSKAAAIKRDLAIDYTAADGRIYAYFVCDGTPTYTTAGDLTFRLTVWED